jgi:hypothetical protein
MPTKGEVPSSGQGSWPTAHQDRVTLTFAGQETPIGGTVRTITGDGAVFVSRTRQALPDRVTLRFGSGEAFDCAVGRPRSGTEFALSFTDVRAFAGSTVKQCLDRLGQLDERHSPAQIGDRLEELHFFGDEEILDLVETCIDSYDKFVRICKDRLIPS